jgi:hypothetical protein
MAVIMWIYINVQIHLPEMLFIHKYTFVQLMAISKYIFVQDCSLEMSFYVKTAFLMNISVYSTVENRFLIAISVLCYQKRKMPTVFPLIVSAQTILFFYLEIQMSQYIKPKVQYIKPKVTVHKCAETIQERKLFKGGNYVRKYGN